MVQRIRQHTISFKNAFHGIWTAFQTQPNFRIHCIIGVLVVIAGFTYHLTSIEWAIITFTILWVLLSEMINTAIESMVDLITVEYSQQAKIAKDVAAGAVLIGAIGSLIIASLIFLPKL